MTIRVIPRRAWRLSLSIASVASALVLSACAPLNILSQLSGEISTPDPSGAPAGFESYYEQSIDWNFCGIDLQCATVLAPTDWSNPESDRINLAVIRHLATSQPPLGDLFVNPGGPGESARDFIRDNASRAVTPEVADTFNLVGLDPRGVGRSTPITCFTDPQEMDDLIYGIPRGDRGSAQWTADVDAASARFAQACLANTGDLLAHVDTASVARDMDMVRAAMGNSLLDYVGYSYGTLLGATYADLFPERVGRMVLDGAVDPTVPPEDSGYGQALAFESALMAYLNWCVDETQCPLGATVDEASGAVSELISDVGKAPLVNADGRRLGSDALVTAIISPLYDDTAWEFLSSLLEGVQNGDASLAFASADSYNGRNADGSYSSNSTEAFVAISCVDSSPVNAERVREFNEWLLEDAPILGPYFQASEDGCTGWPVAPGGSLDPLTAAGAADLLVIGTTNDPATPYESAVSLAGQMTSAHLVTYVGEGHTAYGRGISCIDAIVDAYLIAGELPRPGIECR